MRLAAKEVRLLAKAGLLRPQNIEKAPKIREDPSGNLLDPASFAFYFLITPAFR